MSQISAAAVNELRKRTDLPLMECKKALTEANGDLDKAIDILRAGFGKAMSKREANETAEGRVTVKIAGDTAVIVELRCESAPTAKNDLFGKLADDVAAAVIEHSPADVAALTAIPAVKARFEETVGLIREKMVIHRFTRLTGGVFGYYVHHDLMSGALVQCAGTAKADELLRDIGAHVVALNPTYFKADDIPADALAKEKAFIAQQIKDDPKNASKPANIIEKMSEGKLKTWMAESVLTEQPMANAAKYPNMTIAQALQKAGLTLTKVVRYKVGAG
ncbi:MAG: translation elongation factor Ts [Gemmataceae bacterium]